MPQPDTETQARGTVTGQPGEAPACGCALPPSGPAILGRDEAARRLALLAQLQAALNGRGIRSVLARNHRLVLRWSNAGPSGPSGLTNPRLHILAPGGATLATTDGSTYYLSGQRSCPAADPATAAALIAGHAG